MAGMVLEVLISDNSHIFIKNDKNHKKKKEGRHT
jgi:hypothetical protein